ncbi:MAG: REP-associated tyrosine transposase [Bacteroidales bacterium]|nr:REP-associated tyrosine transposase [Bacteroidales bacterium]
MKKEIFESGYYYHIYNRGNNKENIFKEEMNYNYFLQLAQKYLLPIADIYAYCLLPNHFHILLKIKEIEYLPEIYRLGKRKIHQSFSNFFNAYSKAINKRYGRTGSLFQEHLHRIRIDSEEYFKQLILYIHLNPEKHGLTEDFANYKYSSYQTYFNNSSAWTKRSEVVSYFDGKDNFMYCHHQKKLKLQMLKEIEKLDD